MAGVSPIVGLLGFVLSLFIIVYFFAMAHATRQTRDEVRALRALVEGEVRRQERERNLAHPASSDDKVA